MEGDERKSETRDVAEPDSGPWELTIEDAKVAATKLEADGWDTVVIIAGHTHPLSRAAGDDDRFGLVYVVPDDKAERFAEAASVATFPQYRVLHERVGGRVFQIIQLLDPESTAAVLLVGNYPEQDLEPVLENAIEAGAMYTHVQTLDESLQWTIEHDGYEGFLPDSWERQTD